MDIEKICDVLKENGLIKLKKYIIDSKLNSKDVRIISIILLNNKCNNHVHF